jgi:hypothetical protein
MNLGDHGAAGTDDPDFCRFIEPQLPEPLGIVPLQMAHYHPVTAERSAQGQAGAAGEVTSWIMGR